LYNLLEKAPRRKRKSRAKDPRHPRKGGRPKGSLNKRTLKIIDDLNKKVPDIRRQSLDYLRDALAYITGAMAYKRPWNPDGTDRVGGNYKMFMALCDLQIKYAHAITPYEAARLSAITLLPQQKARTVVNVTILNEQGDKIWDDIAPDRDLKQVETIEAIAHIEAIEKVASGDDDDKEAA
jgi:hypothetical protein